MATPIQAENRLSSLSSILAAVNQMEEQGTEDRPEVRISVLRNFSIELIVPMLKYFCYTSGLKPHISVGDYDNIRQEVLNPTSHIYTKQPDLIVVSMLLEQLDPQCVCHNWDASVARETILSTLEHLLQRTSSLIVVNTFVPPLQTENGLGAARQQEHRVARIHSLNTSIKEFSRKYPGQIFVADWERILQTVGEEQSFDYRFWYMYRAPFKKPFVARYAQEIIKVARALKGKTKKCLVLDCDNTLWGGVVGEDGVSGIALDRHDYPGRCFYDFQQTVVNLIQQGVSVVLCSKNNEEDVWEVFDKHPHFLLKRNQIVAWRINWQNKADNIRSLAQELNLGLDSFVFVDDSGMECQLIREQLPEVTVLQVPQKIYEFPQLLFTDGLFDVLNLSAEDSRRTEMYVADRERAGLKQSATNLEEYLSSLQLEARIAVADESELTRVAQLTGKTNQFNLTTRRYTEAEVRHLAASEDSRVYRLSARDRFGDLGLVGVLIARRIGETGVIDSFLMSCRALGRRFEFAFLDQCLTDLEQAWDVTRWRAEYLPTKKNRQTEHFWESAGFIVGHASPEGTQYQMEVASRQRPQISYISLSA